MIKRHPPKNEWQYEYKNKLFSTVELANEPETVVERSVISCRLANYFNKNHKRFNTIHEVITTPNENNGGTKKSKLVIGFNELMRIMK